MNFSELMSIFSVNGCREVYVKTLAANDISKSQVYLADEFDLLNIFPVGKVEAAPSLKKEAFKVTLDFSWVAEDASLNTAPHAKFILYPQYPEVRFSGFLQGCRQPPSQLMNRKATGRLLFMAVSGQRTLGYVCSPFSTVAAQCKKQLETAEDYGVFKVISLKKESRDRKMLIAQLRRIHRLGWIDSKRLNSQGKLVPCYAPNCGGYTLEAELGIRPNSSPSPDFLGWEIKQFGVTSLLKAGNAVITLMTPEPDGGYYKTDGIPQFISKYGYADKRGRPGRSNFGGIHKFEEIHLTTGLELRLKGFDAKTGRIKDVDGKIALIDSAGEIAASWSFANLLQHWTGKHNQTCYIPSIRSSARQYRYGETIMLSTGTSFELFLREVAAGHIYYDPGIKLETIGRPKTKARSQFRIKYAHLENLYKSNERISLRP